ncbi:MAG: TonB-dependent receptor [Chitinophagaceae bacterium]
MRSKWKPKSMWGLFVPKIGLFVCLFSMKGNILAQKGGAAMKGLVQNEKGEPLSGASVTISDSVAHFTQAATSDSLGSFYFSNLPSKNALAIVVAFNGYKTQTFKDYKLTDNAVTSLYVKLLKDTINLDEVVVVGYGSQRKNLVASAISSVGMDNITSRSMQNVSEALQGKAAGVIVTNEGGDPTASPSVYIRGMGGINGESALYVVDGVIYESMPNINSDDIASMDVLKDGAAAIYGARASGGVILITTKKGKNGAFKASVDAKYGDQSAWRKLHALNAEQFANAMNTAADNAGETRSDAFDASVYPDGQITRTDWVDAIFRHGATNEYNVNFSGGNDRSTFYAGFGYRKSQAILLNTYNQRYNATLNSEHKIGTWLTFGEHLQYSYSNGNGANTSSAYTGAILSAIFYPPNVAVYDSAGNFSGLPEAYAGSYGDVINPVAYLKRLDSKSPTHVLMMNPYIEARITEDLKFRSSFAYTETNAFVKTFTTRVPEIGRISTSNMLEQTTSTTQNLLAEQTLSYDHRWGNHHLSLVGGTTYQKNTYTSTYVYGTDFDDESAQYRYLENAGTIYKPTDTRTVSILLSYLARANYDYDGKYLLSVLGRRDGSSLVSSQNKYENYGSVSAGWIISREDFFKDISWVSLLKLRGSYGILGNLGSLPANAVDPTLSTTTAYFGSTSTASYGYAATTLPNPNLKWATSKQTDIGIDLNLFENHISITADYFNKKTSDMILLKTLPSTSGVTNGQYINAGDARDRGFEFSINYNSAKTRDFQYSVGVNLTHTSNELLTLYDDYTSLSTSDINIRSALTPVVVQIGAPLYAFNLVKTAGIFKTQEEIDSYANSSGSLIQPDATPGDLKFVDANGDGSIDDNDRVLMGSAFPKLTYGVSFNASYKNFDLNLFVQGVTSNKVFNSLRYLALQAGLGGQHYNLWNKVSDAWSETNPNGSIPKLSFSDANGNFSTNSDFFLENGAYMRLKNLTLGYTFRQNVLRKANIDGIRLYFTSNNLLTITKYTGFDPEVGMSNYGIDVARYPQARSFIVGLNVNF